MMNFSIQLEPGLRRADTVADRVCHLAQFVLLLIGYCWVAERELVAAPIPNQREEIVARFPDPEQVVADFTDDAERYAALKILHTTLQPRGGAFASDPVSRRLADYYNALLDVDFKFKQTIVNPTQYNAFSSRIIELLKDQKFQQRVLDKYRVADFAAGPGGAGSRMGSSSSKEKREFDAALRRSIPYWLAALLATIVSAPVFILVFDRRRLKSGSPGTNATVSPLPESLREPGVLARRYTVEWMSGLVMDKESSTEHNVQVTSTSGGPSTVIGDQVFTPAPLIHTTTTATRKDCLWVRDANGNEKAWNFTNSALQARQGHIVSSIGRRLPDGSSEFLLAYNHTTGQMDSFDGLKNAHKTRKLLPWLATTLVGALGLLLAMFAFINGGGGSVGYQALFLPGNWTYPLVIAGVISSILIGMSAAIIIGLRNGRFKGRYVPAYRKLFEECTPSLRKQFGQP